ncbi:MAG: hypothetical protein A2Z07_13140 [Armatimonadetes bacterium RBG_16_67_12]|nr:MAG: hypothetical protein A2Z07_13140 [Armatimonadetes bacterium RBG_16_67_12]
MSPSINGVLIAAPHGTYDRNTAAIAITTARRLGAGYVVFRGIPSGARINVNRPTEGAGRRCPDETPTERARSVYDTYVMMVRAAAGPNPLSFHVEIHGHAAPQRASLTI